ncbi:hypothetical protein [Pseudarthrobacter sp. LT1]|uniref:hypothetical protein n=1 Tax=Pseudarthrobacter sp. LT1 TaxID=3111450 RepID=UPI002D79697F|nr:hypothetical protein [Pseudarthrobacter sp. LT1]WRT13148.1 hypothetical protein VIK36_17590 [Pseudarthrobacter sp. LT1]
MTTRAVASLLRRAWLFAAALAVIAGLLGMHVLTSGHASHGAVSQGERAPGPMPHSAAAGHTVVAHSAGPDHAGHTPAASAADMQELASSACGGSCPGAQESGAPCVPSAPSGPVTLSPPQATLAVLPLLPSASRPGAAYDYLPPSPTPCDLSISRT